MLPKIPRNIYRSVRALLFSTILVVAALYLLVYVIVSMPVVQKKLVSVFEEEVSTFLGSKVTLGSLELYPFNEIRLSNLRIYEPDIFSESKILGEEKPCLEFGQVGAGIDLFELFQGKLVFTYAELSEVKARIYRQTTESPYNIQFIINAFSPKESKESSNLNFKIRTIVIRRLAATYDLLYMPVKKEGFDPFHLKLTNFRADVSIPSLDTKPFAINAKVRRMAFILNDSFEVTDLSFHGIASNNGVALSDFSLKLPGSNLNLNDIVIETTTLAELPESLKTKTHRVSINGYVTPSDLKLFVPFVSYFETKWNIDATGLIGLNEINGLSLNIKNDDLDFTLRANGFLYGLSAKNGPNGEIKIESLSVGPEFSSKIKQLYLSGNSSNSFTYNKLFDEAGSPSIDFSGTIVRRSSGLDWSYILDGKVDSALGNIGLNIAGIFNNRGRLEAEGQIKGDNLLVSPFIGNDVVSKATFETDFKISLEGKNINGCLNAKIPELYTRVGLVKDIKVNLEKNGSEVNLYGLSDNNPFKLDLSASTFLSGPKTEITFSTHFDNIHSELFGIGGNLSGSTIHGSLQGELTGNNINNITGSLAGSSLGFILPQGSDVSLDNLILTSDIREDGERVISLTADPIEMFASGHFVPTELPARLKELISDLLPALNPFGTSSKNIVSIIDRKSETKNNMDIHMKLSPIDEWADLFNLPVRPLVETYLDFEADFNAGTAELQIDAPYLRQGKAKIFRNTKLFATRDPLGMVTANISTETATKRSVMTLAATGIIQGNKTSLDLHINPDREDSFTGDFRLEAVAEKILTPQILVKLKASDFLLSGAEWKVEEGNVNYKDGQLVAKDIKVAHENQYITIDGCASSDPMDKLKVRLSEIDLSYIFDALNINFVNFGGKASGLVYASELFTSRPKAWTEGLKAKDFSYGGALLGNADLSGIYHFEDQRIEIGAFVHDLENDKKRAEVDGNIWVTRDSLSFNFDADKLNASFLGQFTTAFASDVTATASGDCHLFGTFKDINLTGRLKADSIRFRVDFTGVYYGGSDSVRLDPGLITIPSFKVYDRDGNSGIFSGELTHTFLRDVGFDFKLRNARRLLCYDLQKGPDDLWWGTVYASGDATLRGVPGLTTIDVDVTSDTGSTFNFSLSDTEAVRDFNFLTFTDKTPKIELPKRQDPPDYIELYRKQSEIYEVPPGDVHLDIRLNVTPSLGVSLVMDPVSGDKISAHGTGPLELLYATESDEARIYGKYTIIEGLYNFSLQDVILRDFQIREGSSISFNGDPLAADLDITAAYRVNTSLTDLDKSFSFDRDLNRTNVPVDAMLLVRGPIDSPDIDFDIELPTLTEEVSRKVRSIISTNDLMSRQIIYLLALNKFYTPEYMDTSGSGGELTSVASSTISSQLGNALSQLTDKLSVMPSIRSDKGDFSDLEMDVALSSRLLNNRLLINGNFGYRDRTTSTTTFVGDFDVQYLLNRRGTLRLKAYNHFNDQNYYLRQALTTQGLGLEYRHDFNHFMSFLRPKKRNGIMKKTVSVERNDSTYSSEIKPHFEGSDTITQ